MNIPRNDMFPLRSSMVDLILEVVWWHITLNIELRHCHACLYHGCLHRLYALLSLKRRVHGVVSLGLCVRLLREAGEVIQLHARR